MSLPKNIIGFDLKIGIINSFFILFFIFSLNVFAEKKIIVIKSEYKLYLYENDKIKKTYEIGLSQEPIGNKEKKGDNKMPEGEYEIIQKAKGPFEGKWGHYLGKRWMRINYPNLKDAEKGLKNKKISQKEFDSLKKAYKEKTTPPNNTYLGGGIGIHGWLESDWEEEDNRDLSWGCIVMHNKDIEELYDLIKVGIKIIIKP